MILGLSESQKSTVLVYKALNGLSPQYLTDDYQLITTTGRRRLRSSSVATCDVPGTRTNSGRSILHCCWSTSVEQSTTSSPWLWTITSWGSPVTENAFVWLRTVASIVTYFRRNALYKYTYLLTYLLTYPAVGCHYFPPGLRLPSQPRSITALWLVLILPSHGG